MAIGVSWGSGLLLLFKEYSCGILFLTYPVGSGEY